MSGSPSVMPPRISSHVSFGPYTVVPAAGLPSAVGEETTRRARLVTTTGPSKVLSPESVNVTADAVLPSNRSPPGPLIAPLIASVPLEPRHWQSVPRIRGRAISELNPLKVVMSPSSVRALPLSVYLPPEPARKEIPAKAVPASRSLVTSLTALAPKTSVSPAAGVPEVQFAGLLQRASPPPPVQTRSVPDAPDTAHRNARLNIRNVILVMLISPVTQLRSPRH